MMQLQAVQPRATMYAGINNQLPKTLPSVRLARGDRVCFGASSETWQSHWENGKALFQKDQAKAYNQIKRAYALIPKDDHFAEQVDMLMMLELVSTGREAYDEAIQYVTLQQELVLKHLVGPDENNTALMMAHYKANLGNLHREKADQLFTENPHSDNAYTYLEISNCNLADALDLLQKVPEPLQQLPWHKSFANCHESLGHNALLAAKFVDGLIEHYCQATMHFEKALDIWEFNIDDAGLGNERLNRFARLANLNLSAAAARHGTHLLSSQNTKRKQQSAITISHLNSAVQAVKDGFLVPNNTFQHATIFEVHKLKKECFGPILHDAKKFYGFLEQWDKKREMDQLSRFYHL